jgi:alkylhydroperoxidase/carboxymuconolactone decarboxylase family protein YurZ
MSADAERKARIKQDFIDARGYWSWGWDPLLDMAPDYFAAYAKLSSVPWKPGSVLSPKVKELLYIAIDSSTTHMYEPGLRIHIRNALGYSATRDEIMEVMQLTSVLGVHTVTMGVPALLDAMRAAGLEMPTNELTPEQQRLKAEFIAARGYWSETWDKVLTLSPDYFEAYAEFSSVPWKHGTLEPKIKEFIYIAIDSATTHLHEAGTRTHMANALKLGATPAEIMEVLALTSVLGVHTMAVGVPALLAELKRAEEKAKS